MRKFIEKLVCDNCEYRKEVELLQHFPVMEGWVPAKQRMPERDDCFLVCTENGSVCTEHYYPDAPGGGRWAHARLKIVYWRELPKMPRELRDRLDQKNGGR